MREAVSEVLVERAQQVEGLGRMVWVSLAAHAVLLALLMLMPQDWYPRSTENLTPMIISLGGTPGPQTGGMTPIGGRPIQEVAPVAPRTAPAAPAPKPPEMVVPQERPLPSRPRPATPSTTTPPRSTSRTPTRGEEVQEGSARAETGARGSNFGLTTGGGSGTGGYLDVGNFCCPEYLETMRQLIQSNWQSQQQVAGQSQVKFTIQRDGSLTGIELEQSSGYFALDQAAQRALHSTRRLPPLPREFTETHLTVHLVFQYQR